MMDIQDSKVISFIRFPLIVLVVFSHNGGLGGYSSLHPLSEWTGVLSTDLYDLVRLTVRTFAANATMPCFYFMSGYLFFYNVNRWNTNTYVEKSKRRIKTLVIPYLLWNTIAMLYPVLIHLILGIFNPSHLVKAGLYWQQLDWINSYWDVGTGCPFLFPLWYVKYLIVFCLLSPVFYYLMKWRKSWILTLGLLCVSTLFLSDIYLRYIAIFAAGAYLGIHKMSITALIGKLGKSFYLIAAFLFVLLLTYGFSFKFGGIPIIGIWEIIGSILMFVIAEKLVTIGKFAFFTKLSATVFFILAFHNLDFMWFIDSFVGKLYSWGNGFINILFYLFIPLAKVAVCLAVFFVMRKLTPKTLKVLIGGR